MKIFLLTLFPFFLCGCALKYKDVSNDPEYASLINTSYSLTTSMRINGVNLPPGYGSEVDIYMIDPMEVWITGPEMITEDVLVFGTILDVQSIKKTVNHLPGSQGFKAVVEVNSNRKSRTKPVTIRLKYLQSMDYMKKVERPVDWTKKSNIQP